MAKNAGFDMGDEPKRSSNKLVDNSGGIDLGNRPERSSNKFVVKSEAVDKGDNFVENIEAIDLVDKGER